MGYKMKGFSGFKSPLKQGYKPPKTAHDTSMDPEVGARYSPDSGTITMAGGTYGVLSQEELGKIERHETKHHHQVYKRGVKGHRRKDDLDFEKWFRKNTDFKKAAKMSDKEFANVRSRASDKWRKEQYNVPGSNEYEAKQAENKASPGLFRKQ